MVAAVRFSSIHLNTLNMTSRTDQWLCNGVAWHGQAGKQTCRPRGIPEMENVEVTGRKEPRDVDKSGDSELVEPILHAC